MSRRRLGRPVAACVILAVLLVLPTFAASAGQTDKGAGLSQIQHVIVIMQENHSFDNYFGTFPGVIGGYTPETCVNQMGYNGCIKPYHITNSAQMKDPDHSWTALHQEYANGTNAGFYVANGMFPFGYYDGSDIPYYWSLARNYTLMDNYFSSVMGPTLPNHFFLVAGQSGGDVGNHMQFKGLNGTLDLNIPTIFSELTNHHITWNSYSWVGQVNWNPAGFIPDVADNRTLYSHVKFSSDFFLDLRSGSLAQVSWVMPPSDYESDHPPNPPSVGESWVKSVIQAVQKSPYWSSTAIFLTWDESGGYYDMVPPLQADQFGYGFRVPMMIISPFAKHGLIDHTLADHTSTLAFIEHAFGLPPLTRRDSTANDLMSAFSFDPSDALTEMSPVGVPLVSGPRISETYANNLGQTVNGSAYLVLRNLRGQVVEVTSSQITLAGGKTTEVSFVLAGIPVGRYYATIFTVSTQNVPLSRLLSQKVGVTVTQFPM